MPEKPVEHQQTLAELAARGEDPIKAAASMGLTPAAAQAIVRSPFFKALVEKYRAREAKGDLDVARFEKRRLSREALQRMEQRAKDPKTPANVAAQIDKFLAELDPELKPPVERQDTGITIVIEGEAAVRLEKLAAVIDTRRQVQASTEVARRLEHQGAE